ncbi:2,3,4,5-tetrahydropyridine-2,6-dicarboxylate N-succinyltransferase [Marinospirillum alkaliphilum]|uniref:2,3,4,5-tetrahydropyridine-2,6-dicarboxylate N-succinyltransferase n=1 Tax=Marinospirillum alkaliphilum DSM 21637 TaxID=1122209 RepID=A0A1K1W335_9GAMM|nr:2,3,4,5-tetrahydropyridine-2,6-dicarboxylate N-succinyltransferase [Marinospirillum alkaliphilum]SFX31786.1 2,3,4,5-tetrahydropyridine-2-carboxylate N-succinyltransferase [Marinospirillum alkaliphilum DSM 21637]
MSTPQLFACGFGVGTYNLKSEWLEVYYPRPVLNPDADLTQALIDNCGYEGGNQACNITPDRLDALSEALDAANHHDLAMIAQQMKRSHRPLVITLLATDTDPASVPEVYLKLHLLSHRLVKPHGVNLTGAFGLLKNVAWTSDGAIDLEELPQRQLLARMDGKILTVESVDKFPRMCDYVVPAGVRIADTARVRLGAYLGEGTTIMHEGFVNFNAGTEGPNMIEGRISAGVFVGAGSDLGGGCSTMGTLSGGGNIVISVGEKCLIGANAGIGIPLGDRCTVESGLYVTSGSKITLLDDQGKEVSVVAARALANQDDLLFRRNSQTGRIECLANRSAIELNEALHSNN